MYHLSCKNKSIYSIEDNAYTVLHSAMGRSELSRGSTYSRIKSQAELIHTLSVNLY